MIAVGRAVVEVCRRRQSGEGVELVDQVRLVREAAIGGNRRPVLGGAAVGKGNRALEAAHAAEPLRRQADLGGEAIDEVACADACCGDGVAHCRDGRAARERVERARDGGMQRRLAPLRDAAPLRARRGGRRAYGPRAGGCAGDRRRDAPHKASSGTSVSANSAARGASSDGRPPGAKQAPTTSYCSSVSMTP